jgi:hypothetical protein
MAAKARRIFFAFGVLVLALGPAAHPIQAADMAWQMTSSSAADAPGGCGKCPSGDDDGMTSSACFALCAGPTALLSAADAVTNALAPSFHPAAHSPLAGRHDPPDPSPPRLTVLG